MRFNRAVPVVAAIAAVLAAGCGDSNDDGGGAATAAGTASSSGGGIVAEAKANVAKNYAGTDRALPTSAPAPPRGKSVWIIECSANAEGCSAPAAGAAEAAKALGWTTKVVDGKLDPAAYNAAVRDATAAKADAIVLASVDCGLTKASLQAAKKAGIKIAGLYGLDCDDRYAGGGQKLFDAEIQYAGGMTYGAWLSGPYAQTAADYVIAKSGGKAHVIAMQEDDVASVRHIGDGFAQAMKRCSSCQVTTVAFTGADFLNGKLQAKTQTALTQHPNATYVFAPYDAAVTLGIGAGVKASGRDKQVTLLGGEGLTPNIKMIKAGGPQDFAMGAPARWAGWATIDELNRAFAGRPLVDEGIGVQSIDATHNLPTKTTFYDGNAKSDYEANFRRIWGLR
jgi:ribose transport system substrate-binding protein